MANYTTNLSGLRRGEIMNDKQANMIAAKPQHTLDLSGEPRPEVHFITTLNSKFVPGLKRLLETLEENCKLEKWDISIVALDDEVAKAQHPRLRKVYTVAEERKKLKLTTQNQRFAPNFNKLLVWGIDCPDVHIFIDSDTVCVGDLNQLRNWSPDITAVRNFAIDEVTKREEQNYTEKTLPIFNSGVFCFKPDLQMHKDIIAFAAKRRGPVRLGDQEILNDFFARYLPSQVKYASYSYNYRGHLSKQLSHPRSPTEGKPFTEDPKIVHFIHEVKPWMEGHCKPMQENMFAFWKKEISLDEFLLRDRKARGIRV